jgi:hypothetical protein
MDHTSLKEDTVKLRTTLAATAALTAILATVLVAPAATAHESTACT